ncbi:hypothetical protein TYRP_009660 [Tyrophagus putrescentiae]|nr:hypothetical protein TYRP_009660 [Tyrophagus putrescentiae]
MKAKLEHHHHLHQLSLSSDLTTITWTVTTAAEDLFTILEPLLLPLLLKQQPKYISVSTAREEDIRNRASSFNYAIKSLARSKLKKRTEV